MRVLAVFLLVMSGGSADASSTVGSVGVPMVVTQVPARHAAASADWHATDPAGADWFQRARLVVVSPAGDVRVLSRGFHSACDPNVSFDGQRVLFAGKRDRRAPWRIWEIGLNGEGLRAVSPENLEARSPIHVSTLFTLDSPEPWFTTVFVGRERTTNESGRPAASSLYNIKLDGGELRRLTFNPNRNLDPFQTWDGRVIYAAERYPNEPGQGAGRVGLYAIHIEGADMEFYGGGLGQRIQQMPCVTAGGLVVFVESTTPARDRAGQLASVETRRPHLTYRVLTTDAAHVFAYPSPLDDNQVVVARRSAAVDGNWGVFRFDADAGSCVPVFDSREFHDIQAVPAAPRRRPDGHSTVVTIADNFGTFYGLNCYTADAMRAAHIQPGEVKRVRFIEGVIADHDDKSPAADLTPGPFVARRLVGEAPVEPDGSFNVVVPADTPLLLQTLDEQGFALGNCGWIWVKPKETRGCIGCHEDPELVPENDYVQALRRPSNRLLLPPEQRRSVTFRNDIAPIIQRHCATTECHGGTNTPLHLPLSGQPGDRELRKAYAALMTPAQESATDDPTWPLPGRYVDAGRARTSWLVWQIVGQDTSRPWDRPTQHPEDAARKITPMPAHGQGLPLSPEEIQTLIQWIDLGAQFEMPVPAAQKQK